MGDCFMNEIDLALLRHKKRRFDCNKKEDNKISNEFSKILLSIILVLSSVIFIKLDDDNKEWFKGHVLESNFAFMKINEWYHQTFGDILPSFQENTVTAVSEISEGERERYLDGYKFKVLKNTPIKAISSGILVYMGEKEGYKNTFIMQGVDGVDIWYGNIDLLYELDGKWFIVDYKTSFENKNLDKEYEKQLNAYKKALKTIKNIDAEAYIYHIG